MKSTRYRSIGLTFLTFIFLIGLCVLTFRIIINANTWALSSFNKHISNIGLTDCGAITDRNDVILAQSQDGRRTYNKNSEIRKALLHTVGDNSLHISTAVQTQYRTDLLGYNIVTGINCPSFSSLKNNIKLSLDSKLCRSALSQLGSKKGAVAVYNYKTGEILCMVSSPTYDPNSPPSPKELSEEKYEGVYLNRVLSAAYTPGSVFKLITSACGIENMSDIDNKIYNCSKSHTVNGKEITCLSNHQNLRFKDALAKSCNIYFSKLAIDLGKNKMAETANRIGFNRSFEIGKAKTKVSQYNVINANDYDLGWSGIGQYNDLLNPMHMLIFMGAIANDGTAVIPNFISEIRPSNPIASTFKKNVPQKKEISLISKNTSNKLKEAMRYTVKNNYSDSMFPGLNVCAKTGTAEVGGNKKPNAWMVGFSSNEKTPLAFVVIVEDAGFGIKEAGPIAKIIITEACKLY